MAYTMLTTSSAVSTRQVVTPQVKKLKGDNTPVVSTPVKSEPEKKVSRNVDIDELTKKYKNNPMQVLQELGLNFTEEQVKKLSEYIKDEKSLKIFLMIVQEQDLTEDDILAGLDLMKEYQPKKPSFFKRIFGATTEKDEYEHAQHVSTRMGHVRRNRHDFSSHGVARMAGYYEKNPELEVQADHFLTKTNTDGVSVYNEDDVMVAMEYMEAHPETANEFLTNAVELEAIETTDGKMRYNGKTIVRVNKRMSEKPELKETMMVAAHKSDMNNEYLDNITNNLFENPYMEEALLFTLTAKTEDGKDRFSAKNVSNESTYLIDKSEAFCNTYTGDLTVLSQNGNLTGDDIIELNQMMNDNPGCKDEIMSRAMNYTGDGNIVEDCKNYVESVPPSERTMSVETTFSTSSDVVTNQTSPTTNPISNTSSGSQNVNQPKDKQVDKVVINGESYDRATIYNALYKKYGPNAEKVLQNLENPQFIEMMKKFGKNQKLVSALVNDPTVVNRLIKVNQSLTNNQLADMVSLCTNRNTTETMLELCKAFSPEKAIKYMTVATQTNTVDEIKLIMQNKEISVDKKKSTIQNLIGFNVED